MPAYRKRLPLPRLPNATARFQAIGKNLSTTDRDRRYMQNSVRRQQKNRRTKKDGVQSPIATPLKPHHILYYAIRAVVLDGRAIAYLRRKPVAATY